MPRDDLSIDFVKRMPQLESLDPALILEDWINRVANLPEEIRFIQEEIGAKDVLYNECIKTIEDRDGRIQKWIKANGSHEPNPREEGYRVTIRENYDKADQLTRDKIALTQKMQLILDKHLRVLDAQVKTLYDRNEPGFTDPDELPSVLRPSAANHSAPSARSANPAAHPITTALNPIVNSASPTSARIPKPQIRTTQTQQQVSSSAPATPTGSTVLNRAARENSAGPTTGAPKRGPRANSGIGSIPTTSSGLARHSSLGPGTPKSHNTATGIQRAGSAGPRATMKASSIGPGRKAGTPSSTSGRKKGTPAASGVVKSGLSRVKRAAKNSPSSPAETEQSETENDSGEESDARAGGRGTPAARPATNPTSETTGGGPEEPARPPGATGNANPKREEDDDDDGMDLDDDEAGHDKKYCLCQNVSFGDMVACDNDACPYEWFHWTCVGLRSEPNGTWFCPVCRENMKKNGANGNGK